MNKGLLRGQHRAFSQVGLLACVSYAPATRAAYAINSTTIASVDTVNLVVTFTAPASGNVLVRLSANSSQLTSWYFWCLRDHTSGILQGYLMGLSFSNNGQAMATAQQKFTGLTPGTSYTWDWAHATSNNTNAGNMWAQSVTNPAAASPAAPATMEVWAA